MEPLLKSVARKEKILSLVKKSAVPEINEGIMCFTIQPSNLSLALGANADYFRNMEWANSYFEGCHRDEKFRERWRREIPSWDGKIVIDIGCGPGNLLASLGGKPDVMLGIDVSIHALKMAKNIGYECILADAQDLPLESNIADFVCINASLHHCDSMEAVLLEAARIVKPGGKIITDHDPQKTAWAYKGLGMLLWNTRLLLFRALSRGGHTSKKEQAYILASEAHHFPGGGVDEKLFFKTLPTSQYEINIYKHNHTVGAKVMDGEHGKSELKYRVAQLLSGMNPNSKSSALSIMAVVNKLSA